MTSRPFKTRFAPSPTGLLHLGNIRTALFNFLLARQASATFLLRLEDTDAMRGHEKYARALEQDLRWLGLAWNEGPEAGGQHGPYAQSERDSIYKEYFSALETKGQAYPCFCSEHELAIARKTALAAHRPPRYSGKCRALSSQEVQARFAKGEPATLRFRVEEGNTVEFEDKVRGRLTFNTDDIGDYVIRRSDGTPAFFFCNAIDDALMEVTLVVRGEDHLTNTPRQILLLKSLGLPLPEYAHIALVVGADGAPLSKRSGSKSVEELRSVGFLPSAINNYLARLGHTYDANASMNLEILAEYFNLSRLGRAPARYDEAQLMHWQREAVLHLPSAAIREWMGEAVQALVPADSFAAFIEAVRGNISFPADAQHWAQIVFTDKLALSHAAREAMATAGPEFFASARQALEKHGADFKAISDTVKQARSVSGKSLFQPLRAALMGELDGPEMAKLLPLIGVERARKRLSI
ncbi:glutamate--tRNA ligase [Sulfuricaulis sp.]|uniref:glutamate--tRNA ligase n=1 Tax=Sulfuricaulis sp. TaxID=2003553 RepID=UPI0025FA0C71|nr:glutamate--tRNA ligase [Sulfuricaulis sp.]